jgi:hypothetical protein
MERIETKVEEKNKLKGCEILDGETRKIRKREKRKKKSISTKPGKIMPHMPFKGLNKLKNT